MLLLGSSVTPRGLAIFKWVFKCLFFKISFCLLLTLLNSCLASFLHFPPSLMIGIFFLSVSFSLIFDTRLSRIEPQQISTFDWWNSHLLCFPKCIFSCTVFQHSHYDFVMLDHDTTGLWLRSVLLSSQKYCKSAKLWQKLLRDKQKIHTRSDTLLFLLIQYATWAIGFL